jgi:hypothetical protein
LLDLDAEDNMKHNLNVIAGTLFSSVFAITLQAQAPATTAAQADRSTSAKVTLTGCVERADQVAGNSAPAAATVDSLTFVLTHAIKGTADNTPPAPVGTAGSTAGAGVGQMYRLDGATSQLNPHVGHKVEVVGSPDPAATTPQSAEPASAVNAPNLKVDSIKMVSETCAR